MAAIYSSIKQFGFADVVICSKDLEIIAGHGRVMAAKEAGLSEVPVLIVDGLTPTQVKAYRIAHNRSANIAKYDDDALTQELFDIKSEGFNLEDLQPLKLDKWTQSLDLPEFNIDLVEPTPAEELQANDVPDAIFPSDNPWGVPTLNIKFQADALDLPVVQHGDISKHTKFRGTYMYWTEDDKFESLWKDPTKPLASRCVNCVEPNFSNYDQMARAYVLGMIYKKRWISYYWQTKGIRIFVDLNVNYKFYDLNLLGVPRGWKAWATRGYAKREDKVLEQYELAVKHAETDNILFWIYSGGDTIKKLCQDHGWLFVEDRRKFDRATWTKQFEEENARSMQLHPD